jgi:hypothetical protein
MSHYDSDSDNDSCHSDNEQEGFNTCDDDRDDYQGDWGKGIDRVGELIDHYLHFDFSTRTRRDVVRMFGEICLDAFYKRDQRITYNNRQTTLGFELMRGVMLEYYVGRAAFGVPPPGLTTDFARNKARAILFDRFMDKVRRSVTWDLMRGGSTISDNNPPRENDKADSQIIREYEYAILTGERGLYVYEFIGDDKATHYKYFTLPRGGFERFMIIATPDMRRFHQKVLGGDQGAQITL